VGGKDQKDEIRKPEPDTHRSAKRMIQKDRNP
jgi:hypothetical protein